MNGLMNGMLVTMPMPAMAALKISVPDNSR